MRVDELICYIFTNKLNIRPQVFKNPVLQYFDKFKTGIMFQTLHLKF